MLRYITNRLAGRKKVHEKSVNDLLVIELLQELEEKIQGEISIKGALDNFAGFLFSRWSAPQESVDKAIAYLGELRKTTGLVPQWCDWVQCDGKYQIFSGEADEEKHYIDLNYHPMYRNALGNPSPSFPGAHITLDFIVTRKPSPIILTTVPVE